MKVPALNLLRHPRRAGNVWARAGFGLAGALTGLCLAGLWQQWQSHRLESLQIRHAVLKDSLRMQNAAKAEQARQRETAQTALRMAERAQDWQNHREQIMRVHSALQVETLASQGRVERWQVDTRGLSVQLWWPRADLLPSATAALTQAGPARWTVGSLSGRTGGGVVAVLESTWPPMPSDRQRQDKP